MDPLAASREGDALSVSAVLDALAVAAGPDPLAVAAGPDPLAVAAGTDPLAVGYAAGALAASDPIGLDPTTGYPDATLGGGARIAPPVPATPAVQVPAPLPPPARSRPSPHPGGPVSWNDLTIRGRGTQPPPGRTSPPEWARRSAGVPRPAAARPAVPRPSAPAPLPPPGGSRRDRRAFPPPPAPPPPAGPAPPPLSGSGDGPGRGWMSTGAGWDDYFSGGVPRRTNRRGRPTTWTQGADPSAQAVLRAIARFLKN